MNALQILAFMAIVKVSLEFVLFSLFDSLLAIVAGSNKVNTFTIPTTSTKQ